MTKKQREKAVKIFAILAIGSLLMTSIASLVFSVI
jgi:hypothetical protein